MKVIIARAELLNLIGKIQSIVPARPSSPILGNILLEAVADELIISATDLSVSMRAFISADVKEEGAIALPAKRFFQLIRELTTPEVEIHCQSPEVAHINAGSSHFKMSGMHKNEFPSLPDLALSTLSSGLSISIPSSLLKEMLIRSSFAAARDDNRQVLNGILVQHLQKMSTFIGTDGKRLARLHTTIDSPEEHQGSYILPLKALEEMIKILDGKEENSKLYFMADKIAIETGSVTLMGKLLAGQYPDVNRIIPQKMEAPIALHREELLTLLRQVSLFTPDSSTAVRFTFTTGELHISSVSGEIGEGRVSMAVNYGGPKLEVAFNPHYFMDILRHTKDETVQFTLKDAFTPGLITDSTSANFVIMPMRIEV